MWQTITVVLKNYKSQRSSETPTEKEVEKCRQ